MVVFFLCEAKNIQRGLSLFGSPAPYRSCLLYAVTGFFFSSVTPSASGGQPMQLYAMYRDGHSPAHGALALLLEFFSFQLAAVTLGVGGFLLHKSQLLAMPRGVLLCFLVGAVLNLVVVFLLAGAVISPRLLPALGRGLMVPASRFFPRRASGRTCASASSAARTTKSSWGPCFSRPWSSCWPTTASPSGSSWPSGSAARLCGA